MRKILIIACVMILVGILAGGACVAGVPGSISYQGKLTDTLGQPVSDGTYEVQFKLYTANAGGTAFWAPVAQNVTTSGGVFTTQLTPLAASDLAGKTDVWLEIWVGSPLVALSPRTKFTSVPYALISLDSWSLLGNVGTTPGTNFIGTTDDQPLEFRVNNFLGFRLEPTSGTPNIIGGFYGNTVTAGASGATISGGGESGFPNSVTSSYGAVGGGSRNTASNLYATVGGGYGNTASAQYATVGGGAGNIASNYYATVGGGSSNTASDQLATVGGGYSNIASGLYATVGGGYSNTASGNFASVGGGYGNTAGGWMATIGGGYGNTASGDYSFAAGRQAKANHNGAFVWADSAEDFASTAANQFLIRASGGVGIGANDPAAALDVSGLIRSRSGGFQFPDGTTQTTAASPWGLTGNAGTIPGTNFIGTTDDQPLEFRVNNTPGFRLEPTYGTPNVIGGFSGNTVTAGATGATISGGGISGAPNSVTQSFGTVGGGALNTASNLYATVGGGYGNTASGSLATVGGGFSNIASGQYATVGGGFGNSASNFYATVGGGSDNTASGDYSFAAGQRAKAAHNGSFVWSDSTTAEPNFFTSTAADQFLIKASGGVGIGTSSPTNALSVAGDVDIDGNLSANIVYALFVLPSDLRYKTNIETISNSLDKVMKLRGVNFDWNKSEYPKLAFGDGRQVGFVAQEIVQVLPEVVSKDDKGFYSVAYGSVVPVLVEAMKEQNARLDRLETENGSLQRQIDGLKKVVAALVRKEQEKP